jgi:hypothetical protein
MGVYKNRYFKAQWQKFGKKKPRPGCLGIYWPEFIRHRLSEPKLERKTARKPLKPGGQSKEKETRDTLSG